MLPTLQLCFCIIFSQIYSGSWFYWCCLWANGTENQSEHVLLIKSLFMNIEILLIWSCFWVISPRVLPVALVWRHFYHVLNGKKTIHSQICMCAEIAVSIFFCFSLDQLLNHSLLSVSVGGWVVLKKKLAGYCCNYLLSRQRLRGK